MRENRNIFNNIDWLLVGLYFILTLMGWFNIYAAGFNENHPNIFDLNQSYGRQFLWISVSLALALGIMLIDGKFFPAFAYPIYGLSIFLLILVFVFGKIISGSKSWFQLGSYGFQPSEFAKFAANLALAKFMSTISLKVPTLKNRLLPWAIFLGPSLLILLQNDTGSALVFFAFVFVLYREGFSSKLLYIGFIAIFLFVTTLIFHKLILLIAIAIVSALLIYLFRKKKKEIFAIAAIAIFAGFFVFSVDYTFDNLLEKHQKDRINVLLGKEVDMKGVGYNVNQSKIAIGSGGLWGKGYLQGTQTKFNFVPEQSTDFIFCTVGEEWGFMGSITVIIIYISLLARIIFVAERQRSNITRIYGYGVASILFFHFFVNIGMTLGLVPVIGIPLPFFSYGGSSMMGFTILLFVFIKQDSCRMQLL